jgi:hypothetical protein
MLIGYIILGSEGNAENSSTYLARDFGFVRLCSFWQL